MQCRLAAAETFISQWFRYDSSNWHCCQLLGFQLCIKRCDWIFRFWWSCKSQRCATVHQQGPCTPWLPGTKHTEGQVTQLCQSLFGRSGISVRRLALTSQAINSEELVFMTSLFKRNLDFNPFRIAQELWKASCSVFDMHKHPSEMLLLYISACLSGCPSGTSVLGIFDSLAFCDFQVFYKMLGTQKSNRSLLFF